MTNPPPDVGSDLRALMQALNLNNSDLGRMLDMDHGAVAGWLVDPPAWLLMHLRLVLDMRQGCTSVFGATVSDLPQFIKARLSGTVNESGLLLSEKKMGATTLEPMEKTRKPPMSPDDFDAALARIGWRRADFARRAGVTDNTVWSWMKQKTRIPGWVSSHLALLEHVHALQAYVQPDRPRKARSSP